MFKILLPSPMSTFSIFLISSGGARGGHGWVSAQPEFIQKSELPEITHNGPGYRLYLFIYLLVLDGPMVFYTILYTIIFFFIHTNTLTNNLLYNIQATHFNEVSSI